MLISQQMPPRLAANDQADILKARSVLDAELLKRHITERVATADFPNLIGRQDGTALLLAVHRAVASLRHLVRRIFAIRGEKQMSRIAAWRIVAPMGDAHSDRDRSVDRLVDRSMDRHGPTVLPNLPIAVLVPVATTRPAAIRITRGIDRRPQSLTIVGPIRIDRTVTQPTHVMCATPPAAGRGTHAAGNRAFGRWLRWSAQRSLRKGLKETRRGRKVLIPCASLQPRVVGVLTRRGDEEVMQPTARGRVAAMAHKPAIGDGAVGYFPHGAMGAVAPTTVHNLAVAVGPATTDPQGAAIGRNGIGDARADALFGGKGNGRLRVHRKLHLLVPFPRTVLAVAGDSLFAFYFSRQGANQQ